jgi:hypothetical protein
LIEKLRDLSVKPKKTYSLGNSEFDVSFIWKAGPYFFTARSYDNEILVIDPIYCDPI